MMRRLIRADGTSIDLPEPISMARAHALINATICDTVALHHLGQPLHVMLLDDLGYETKAITDGDSTLLVPMTARKPVNVEATRLYHLNCIPGTTHQIVGDVLVMPDDDYAPEGSP